MHIGHAYEIGVTDLEIQAFYRAEWTRRLAFDDDAFYRWQFRMPPANNGLNHCCVAVDEQDRIAGVMGLNRRAFVLDGQEVDGAELTTWVTAKSHHGGGVGGRILQFLLEHYAVMFGTGISQDALPLYLRSGFRYLRALPRMVRVYQPKAVASISTLDSHGSKLLQYFGRRRVPQESRITSEEVTAGDWVPGTIPANHYDRSAAALKWRYGEHPTFEYRLFRVEAANEPPALVVLRHGRYEDISFCHVTEILSTHAYPGAALRFIDLYSEENGLAFADFFGTFSAINGSMLAAGWISTVDDMFIRIPHLFLPLEVREPPTTSLIYWARDDMHHLADLGRLYFTKGDTDLDRPTAFAQSID